MENQIGKVFGFNSKMKSLPFPIMKLNSFIFATLI